MEGQNSALKCVIVAYGDAIVGQPSQIANQLAKYLPCQSTMVATAPPFNTIRLVFLLNVKLQFHYAGAVQS